MWIEHWEKDYGACRCSPTGVKLGYFTMIDNCVDTFHAQSIPTVSAAAVQLEKACWPIVLGNIYWLPVSVSWWNLVQCYSHWFSISADLLRVLEVNCEKSLTMFNMRTRLYQLDLFCTFNVYIFKITSVLQIQFVGRGNDAQGFVVLRWRSLPIIPGPMLIDMMEWT
jgi:hypothetical protein